MNGKEVNKAFLAILTAIFVSFTGLAQAPASSSGGGSGRVANAAILPLSEVKTGMKGTARTVFQGSQAEEFTVEILGILPGAVGPKQDLIIGKLSGANVARTSVFAGMSGSPVYIDGKLIGRLSYSFPFSKEPICGITPIQQMIGIFQQNKGANNTASS